MDGVVPEEVMMAELVKEFVENREGYHSWTEDAQMSFRKYVLRQVEFWQGLLSLMKKDVSLKINTQADYGRGN